MSPVVVRAHDVMAVQDGTLARIAVVHQRVVRNFHVRYPMAGKLCPIEEVSRHPLSQDPLPVPLLWTPAQELHHGTSQGDAMCTRHGGDGQNIKELTEAKIDKFKKNIIRQDIHDARVSNTFG
mmetsp:Transcript_29880/g.79520  ORF Transcript_29880/g.79520 Transcript_29880/m.79520 type:complete len:123 (+) Transcript_29880:1126-1494(+)